MSDNIEDYLYELPSNEFGGPAFPSSAKFGPDGRGTVTHFGMTLRDYFAAKAMQSLVSNPSVIYESFKKQSDTKNTNKYICMCAYGIADDMLAAREVQK